MNTSARRRSACLPGNALRRLLCNRLPGNALRRLLCNRLPGNAWQRGSIENANGTLRIRRAAFDMPRKTDLKNYTGTDIQDQAMLHNNTPRKCLGYQTPAEVMLIEIDRSGAALGM